MFMGIRASFVDEFADLAAAYVAAIGDALKREGLPGYHDPAPLPQVFDGTRFGRSTLDHHAGESLAALATLAGSHGIRGHITLLLNPYRVAFLPSEFPAPLITEYTEVVEDEAPAVRIFVGSAPALLRELQALAPHLGIELADGELADALAARIDAREPLAPDEDPRIAEEDRTAWLVIYEGARLAVEHDVALSLAG